jgi:hypothetical protein
MKVCFDLDGEYYRARQALAAAEIFNPLFGKHLSSIHANYLIMKLKYFGFSEFNLPFLQQMTKEADTITQLMLAPFK